MKYALITIALLLSLSYTSCKKPNNGGIVEFTCICGGGFTGTIDTTIIKATSIAIAEEECTKNNSYHPDISESYGCELR